MKSKIKFLSLSVWIAIIALILLNYSCNKDDDKGGLEGDVIGGVLLAPDGSTPIAGATVYVPVSAKSTKKLNSDLFAADCSEPDEAYIVYTCTDYDGSFELNVAQIEGSSFTLRIAKGSFIKDFIIDLNTSGNNLGNLALPSDPGEGAGYFAVVTGSYDRMQDILAKLGMGEIDSYYKLVQGTEKFDLYDGAYSFDFDIPLFEEIFATDPLIGNPKIGEEVLQAEREGKIADLQEILRLLQLDFVHDVIPVDTQGIAYEARMITQLVGRQVKFYDGVGIDLEKPAGPATAILVTVDGAQIERLAQIIRKPITTIGKVM